MEVQTPFYLSMHARTNCHPYLNSHARTYTQTHTLTYTHILTSIHPSTHTHLQKHTYTHIYTRAHKQTFTPTYVPVCVLLPILGRTLSSNVTSRSRASAWRPSNISMPMHSEKGCRTVAAITTLPEP